MDANYFIILTQYRTQSCHRARDLLLLQWQPRRQRFTNGQRRSNNKFREIKYAKQMRSKSNYMDDCYGHRMLKSPQQQQQQLSTRNLLLLLHLRNRRQSV